MDRCSPYRSSGYTRAQRVIVWLGTGDEGQKKALEQLGSHSPSVQAPGELESLLALCENDYWDRIWIVQEVILAKKLLLKYDNQKIPWSSWLILHRKQPYLRVVEDVLQQCDEAVKE
ncbi:hypothetical protein G647_08018 [Cladophialophora carrionii CBS 160.54]|uniref:Heterokaryon incompatibility domain-containing protein n=1 Tax=Cladophialophora carrionii CBS 160.54 TaxID=1279043 RepID=V9D4S2_9EURO|nr:uncharacterized protein G647_08018 [Cladophialophora carrionii CBS 160.54]ETI21671.1 hypothetical protein G647_08018 [Cladophialophora carrionii CBS 160.54]